jgi:sialic acid synthase SpsE
MKQYVDQVRKTEAALRYIPRTDIQPEESAFKQRILYRLVLKAPIQKGETVTMDHVKFLRTDQGIDARDFDKAGNTGIALHDLDAGLIPIDGLQLNS